MADSTLLAIQEKVRKLTHSPDPNQLSDAQINEYVNTFLLYDLPQELALNTLKTNFQFYTKENQDTYENSTTIGDPFYQFKDKYTAIYGPIFVDGYQIRLSQSQQEFYRLYPQTSENIQVGTGDGLTTAFSGTLSKAPVLQNTVAFSAIDVTGATSTIYDDGTAVMSTNDGTGTINFDTGAYTLLFNNAPASGEVLNVSYYSYQPSRPNAILYFDNKFVLRPVPDKTYVVKLQVSVRPTELLSTGQSPELEQWWQMIAFGAAIKVYQDRMDPEGVELLMPEFKKQETLVLRRTLKNMMKERSSTIYTSGFPGVSGYRYYQS